MAEEIARRTGLDVDRDPYPMLAASDGAHGGDPGGDGGMARARPQRPLADPVDETFTLLARGLPSRAPPGG